MFIRGTCSCDECMAHEAEMQAFNAGSLPLDKLNNPGWDPICFASNDAFAYFMPGLVKLVLENTDDYVRQFIFHLSQPERFEAYTPQQARVLSEALDFLVLEEAKALDENDVVDEVYRIKATLERLVGGDRK